MEQGRCMRAQGQNTRAQGLNMKEQGQEHCMREQGQNTRAPVQGLGHCMRRRRNRRKVLLQQQRRRGTLSCHQRGFSSPGSSKSLEGCKISFRLKFSIQSQVCHSDISKRGTFAVEASAARERRRSRTILGTCKDKSQDWFPESL